MNNKTIISEKLYTALSKKYESEIYESEATLLIYFTNPVGIGEHPQHIEEMDKLVDRMTTANDKLEKLKEFYKYNKPNN